MRLSLTISLIALIAGLAACNGGGGSSSSSSTGGGSTGGGTGGGSGGGTGGGTGGGGTGNGIKPQPSGPLPSIVRSWHFDALNYSTVQAKNLTGEGIIVAVIDTGVDVDNPYLQHVLNTNSTRFRNGAQYANFQDTDGHGTSMASLIAGGNYENGVLIGLAPKASILVIAADDGTGAFYDDDLAKSIEYARDKGAKIINLSLGSPLGSFADLDVQALMRATGSGLIAFVATGNSGPDGQVDFYAYHAGDPRFNGLVVAVTALANNGEIASFAAPCKVLHPEYCIAAPGQGLYEAELPTYATGYNTTGLGSGTSHATAIASASMALLLEAFPNLTPRDALNILLQTATDMGEPGVDLVYGVGAINLARALQPVGTMSLPNGQTLNDEDNVNANKTVMGTTLSKAKSLKSIAIKDAYQREYTLDMRQGVTSEDTGLKLDDQDSFNIRFRYQDIPWNGVDWAEMRYGNLARATHPASALYYIDSQINANPFAQDLQIDAGLGAKFGSWGYRVNVATTTDSDKPTAKFLQGFLTHDIGAIELGVGASLYQEDGAFLGTTLSGAYGEIDKSQSTALHVGARAQQGDWEGFIRGAWLQTDVNFAHQNGIFTEVQNLNSSSFAAGLAKNNTLIDGDRFDLALAQNLRIDEGTLVLNDAITKAEDINLAPDGHEISVELGYKAPVTEDFDVKFNYVYQIDPNQVKDAEAEQAFALRAEYRF